MINVTVRAKPDAVVYDIEGHRVPSNRYISVPISPGIVRAIYAGDLEQQGGPVHVASRPQVSRYERHRYS